MIKWIGQHIFDLIARFRGDVYLEDIADGTVASDKFLGLDANNKIVKETVSTTVTDLHSAGVDGAANQLLTDDGDGTVTSEANLTFSSEALRIGADDDGEATIGRNTHSDGNGGDLFIAAGDGTGTDKTGGDLKLNGGASTGSALGGEILMYGSQRQGSSNANVNTQVLLWQTIINDSIIQQQLSTYKGPTDGHFYIESDDSLTLTTDIDNDSTAPYFAIKDYTNTKLLMPYRGDMYLMSATNETGLFLDATNSIISAGSKAAHSGTDAHTDTSGAANTAGKTLTITGGAGTGTGDGGGISFGTYPAGSSSVNVNTTYEEKMAMDKDGNLQIDGGLTTGSTSFVNSSGVVQVATQGTIDHDSLANFVAAEHYDWSSDISGTATIHANNITDLHGAGVSGAANQLLTDDGDGTVTSESGLTYDSEILNIGNDDDGVATIKRATHSDGDGGDLYVRGGDATDGQTNTPGGGVRLYAGRSTGDESGGNIGIFGVPAGSSGTSLNSVDTTQAIAVFKSDGKTTTLGGNLIFEGSTPDVNETTFSITDPTADRTITVPDATGTMCVSGASGSNYVLIGAGTAYIASPVRQRYYIGNSLYGWSHFNWASVYSHEDSSGTAWSTSNPPTAGDTFQDVTTGSGVSSSSEDLINSGMMVPVALSKVQVLAQSRSAGSGASTENVRMFLASADRNTTSTDATWTILATNEVTQVQGRFVAHDLTYTGSIGADKSLFLGFGINHASKDDTTNLRISFNVTGFVA